MCLGDSFSFSVFSSAPVREEDRETDDPLECQIVAFRRQCSKEGTIQALLDVF